MGRNGPERVIKIMKGKFLAGGKAMAIGGGPVMGAPNSGKGSSGDSEKS
jgi:hypothetical protein